MNRREAISAIGGVSLGMLAGLKGFEGKENAAYVERVAGNQVVTVCYGHTRTAKLGQKLSDSQCDALLMKDLNEVYAPIVRRMVHVPLHQWEFDALVDFVYNVKAPKGGFENTTLFRLVNAGRYEEAALQFERWMFVNGKDCRLPANKCGGIPRRREWERRLFQGEFHVQRPQV